MYDYLVTQSPERYREWTQLRIDALNHALQGIPEDRVRYHICFGSWHVPHVADAPLPAIIDPVLQVNAGAYSFEAANPRHEHEWTLWQDHKLAEGKEHHPGHRHAPHDGRRASRAGGTAHRALRQPGRPRERDCRDGLRLWRRARSRSACIRP